MKKQSSMPAPPTRYWLAVCIALILLLGTGAGYRLLAMRYADDSQYVPLAPGTLAKLPMHISEWDGVDVPLDERIIQATDTDDHINRNYCHRSDRSTVSFWLAYGVRSRDLMPHRPEVCYPGAGWTLDKSRTVQLKASDNSTILCCLYEFSRGALRSEGIIVLNYYLVDGQYGEDVSIVRHRAWKFRDYPRHVAQVQISCQTDPFRSSAEKAVCDFAIDSAKAVRELLEMATGETGSTNLRLHDHPRATNP